MIDPLGMALIEFDAPLDTDLHVDLFGLSIGGTSVGLPMSSTTDIVLERYIDLVRLVERRNEPRTAFVADDIEVLASATDLSVDVVAERLRQFSN